MTIYPSHRYANPERILLAEEAEAERRQVSCKGCVSLITGWGRQACELFPTRQGEGMWRCEYFREEGVTWRH